MIQIPIEMAKRLRMYANDCVGLGFFVTDEEQTSDDIDELDRLIEEAEDE